jgi:selenocysteine-specific elongation factor
MRSLVVGTAGHIDHGKSAIVKALTGTDPDRLKEEQARGITIDLGFAHLAAGDVTLAFVDVPGHERFVRNMLAGAGGLDAVLLVVAADESVKPQTREHFEICRLLGIERGVIALSKSDLADADMLEIAALEVRDLVAGSFLADAPMLPVSARTGAGLDALVSTLAALAGARPRQARDGVVRLPVDRAFSVKGFGAVVTGTLVSGDLARDAELDLLPAGGRVRVRGVQVHNQSVDRVRAPERVAVNLGGIDAHDLSRGVTLATPGTVSVTRRLDARLELILSARALKHGARVRVHQGTSEIPGRVSVAATRRRGDDDWHAARPGDPNVLIDPGGSAYVRIRLERPGVLTRADRLILRAFSPPMTIGGGVVLDPEAPSSGVRRESSLARFLRLDDPATFLGVWLADAGARGLDETALIRRGGLGATETRAAIDDLVSRSRAVRAAHRLFEASVPQAIEARVLELLTEFHRAEPGETGLPREALRDRAAPHAAHEIFDAAIENLRARRQVAGTDRLALATHRPAAPAEDTQARDRVLAHLQAAGLTPPDAASLSATLAIAPALIDRVVQALVRERALVRVDAWVFHPDALATLKADVRGLAAVGSAGAPATVDVATFKSRYGLSRKFAIPLLEWLDRERVTRRVGQSRVIL